MRYAWLEFHRGIWLLLTDEEKVPATGDRKWMDKDAALSDLAAEGWMISGPFPRRQKVRNDSRRRFYGFALIRTIH